MKDYNFINSVMKFNERVLDRGYVNPEKDYTMIDLKNKLSFNMIFWRNIQEIYQKYDYTEICDDYQENLKIYKNNINNIINNINVINPNIQFSHEDCFERRFEIEKRIRPQIITRYYPSLELVDYQFLTNIIYYISYLPNNFIAVSFIDPRSSIYTDPLCLTFAGTLIYWKTDKCVIDYLNNLYNTDNTIAINVTSSLVDNKITKVECNSNKIENCYKIVNMFPETSLVIFNSYIYTDDIENVINKEVSTIVQESQSSQTISIQEILKNDKLYEYPNDSFKIYLQFLNASINCKNTESIYITLYRIGDNAQLYYVLKDAVRKGIKVYLNIELNASGEIINKMWMNEMRKIGITVSTFASGILKVHSKLTLVRFKNNQSILQVGTGNYNSDTTHQYTDLSLLTSDKDICDQAWILFQILLGLSNIDVQDKIRFNEKFLVSTSSYNARRILNKLIKQETDKGSNGYITIKANALDDKDIIKRLDNAAKNGCNIYLIIRGVCTWVPLELGKNVTIKSIVWDKLEHSRVYCFGNKNPSIYLGSLDLVTHKLDKRIETLVKITDPNVLLSIGDYLNRYIVNMDNAWTLLQNGEYMKEKINEL